MSVTGPSATTPRNEAAERLLDLLLDDTKMRGGYDDKLRAIDAALSEERRLTVDAIRSGIWPDEFYGGNQLNPFDVKAILDEIGGSR